MNLGVLKTIQEALRSQPMLLCLVQPRLRQELWGSRLYVLFFLFWIPCRTALRQGARLRAERRPQLC